MTTSRCLAAGVSCLDARQMKNGHGRTVFKLYTRKTVSCPGLTVTPTLGREPVAADGRTVEVVIGARLSIHRRRKKLDDDDKSRTKCFFELGIFGEYFFYRLVEDCTTVLAGV